MAAKRQDKVSQRYLLQLQSSLNRFAAKFPGPILDITGAEIDAWLRTLEISSVRMPDLYNQVTALARALGLDWPRNVLRHSFIGYRIAKVKSADEVALEAGNSATIIFKHYRELTTEELADTWFSILPKNGQWGNSFHYDRSTRKVTLPKSTNR
ncbi:MAG: hypothetical protein NTW21_15145 [Verrucomicrobia bacterium]|nr:hypothetical protein [Verrucomicrobiota bacterium]